MKQLTLAYRVLTLSHFPLGIVIHRNVPPSDLEWEGMCSVLRGYAPYQRFKGLVFTPGTGPNAGQRARIRAALQGYEAPGAIVTSSLLVRGIVQACRLFDKRIHAFPTSDLVSALDFLAVPYAERPRVYEMVQDLWAILHSPEDFRSEALSGI